MTPKTRPKRKAQDPEIFFNRELSWLAFNARVLEEVEDAGTPLAERAKFMAIVTNNLDEFFMVRVASLKNAIAEGDTAPDSAGLSPAQQLAVVKEMAALQLKRLHEISEAEILPSLLGVGIRIVDFSDLEAPLRASVVRFFKDEVLPVITPLGIDAARPFPMLPSLSLNLAVLFEPDKDKQEEEPRLGVVPVPAVLPRLVRVPGADSTYVRLETVVLSQLSTLFPGQVVRDVAAFRVLRDAELDIDDEGGGDDFLSQVEDEVRGRRRSQVVRLDIDAKVSEPLLSQLVSRFPGAEPLVYRIQGPLDLRLFFQILDLPVLDSYRDPRHKAQLSLLPTESADLFSLLSRRDVLLHHPYESFDLVLDFVRQAAADAQVLAIKQTLYRPASDSDIIKALVAAAEAGKQVTVVVELTARFDEASNIRWARRLEDAGAHVIYGIRGLKTHAKATLVVRREPQGIRRYVHLSTGNYNEKTSKLYTDIGLLSADEILGRDLSAFFNAITGFSDPPAMQLLTMAPMALRIRILAMIDRERRRAEEGQPALIRAKMNALVDEDIIRALYAASTAGVKIKLNVRGICCLRPGLKGVSENIEVVSIIDRYLEHSRIYHFCNGGDEEHYIASADWMPRNLDRRIELMTRITAKDATERLSLILDWFFEDNQKTRVLEPDGTYRRRKPGKGEDPSRVQVRLYEDAKSRADRLRAVPMTLEPIKRDTQS
ncbi:MAG: polyphosphate kinase 1 [Vicinamibacteria bacterium]